MFFGVIHHPALGHIFDLIGIPNKEIFRNALLNEP
jgi:hypothetical protein